MVVKQVLKGNSGNIIHGSNIREQQALEISDSALAAWRGDSVLELGHDSKAKKTISGCRENWDTRGIYPVDHVNHSFHQQVDHFVSCLRH